MEVVSLPVRLLALAVLTATAASSQAANTAEAASTPSAVELQSQRLQALTSLANAASPENVPDSETLVTATMVAMDIADPALVPPAGSGTKELPTLMSVCRNAQQVGNRLALLAQATPNPPQTASRMSVAFDRSAIMDTVCVVRTLDMQSRELLKQPAGKRDPNTLAALQRLANTLPDGVALFMLGATLTDLNSNSRARTAADALPVLQEAAGAMTPELRRKTLDAVEGALKPYDNGGRLDREVRARLLAPLEGSACEAGCQVLGAAAGAAP